MLKILLTYIIIVLSANICCADPVEECSNSMKLVFESLWFGGDPIPETEKAIEVCLVPAGNGDLKSQYDLSVLYFYSNNEQESEDSYFWVTKVAKTNHGDAQYRLAKIYENGKIVKKDLEKTDLLLNKSAKNGYLMSQKSLGEKYTRTAESKEIYFIGISWFEKAADQGDKMSIIELINIYSNGSKYIKPDENKVKYWSKRYEKIF